MKNFSLILLLLFLIILPVKSNMASPDIKGSMPSTILRSNDIDILNENLTITFSKKSFAYFDITYTILNNKEEAPLTLLFDVVDEFSEFSVYFDSYPIELGDSKTEMKYFLNDSINNTYENYSLFTLIVPKGEHSINIQYTGYADINLSEWIRKYSLTYNLEPAKHWKSFQHLDLEIDVSQLNDPTTVTIQDSIYELTGNHKWSFDSIPQDQLIITCHPKGNFRYIIEPSWIFYLVLFLFSFFNFMWLKWWRRRNVWKKYSIPIIIGFVIVPLISLISYMLWYPIMDSLIGDDASERHGYYFLA